MKTKYSEITKMALITFGVLGFLILGSLFYDVKLLDLLYLGIILFYSVRFLLIKRV